LTLIMERSATRDTLVGLFVLAGLLAVAFLSLRVGGFSLSTEPRLRLYASFDEIGGLKPRAPVVISGVKVGEVGPIVLDEDARARVELNVDAALHYPSDSSASILTAGVLGDRYVSLQLGGDDVLLEQGDKIPYTESAVVLERILGKLIHNASVGEDSPARAPSSSASNASSTEGAGGSH
jgi:phospholipid/cholesterol/gamma-HCH transport system substrate-binding protein